MHNVFSAQFRVSPVALQTTIHIGIPGSWVELNPQPLPPAPPPEGASAIIIVGG